MKRGKGLKLGVIGAGVMGRNHARIAAQLPGLKIIGIADINLSLAEEVGSDLGIAPYQNYRDLAAEIDAVCLATPALTHFEIARYCLENGKHLLLEKPFSGNSSATKQLIKLAKARGLVLKAGFIERFNPAFVRLLKEIKGERIVGVDLKRLSPLPERIGDTDVIFDMMIHDLDLLGVIINDEITHLEAKGQKIRTGRLDRVQATVTFKTGVIARIEANRVNDSKVRKVAVTTDKLLIEADLLNKSIYLRDFSSPTPSTIPVKPADQLSLEILDFASAVKHQQAVYASAENAVAALVLAEGVKNQC